MLGTETREREMGNNEEGGDGSEEKRNAKTQFALSGRVAVVFFHLRWRCTCRYETLIESELAR